ncbi:serine/threonine protein phosphatase 1 [Citrobacter koseri]|uniref:Serine/threonine protein phosphatase 1 n=1 Tax=Citrobacter koseri TaxID=545 RepID=A0A3S4KIN9_CITKO|nr:serine/threonine protein phosphatase 1 [Citrobacter koseri]
MKQPENVYQKIEGSQWRHVWIVGDLHGCFSLLMEKLRQCRFDPWQDLLVSVGECDRPWA